MLVSWLILSFHDILQYYNIFPFNLNLFDKKIHYDAILNFEFES